ncbi:MAG: GNAT family N-acetyltransferase [Brachymonas sp.]|nr:GNAT family N-acetyltransferase [Brachymonas sp.]
MPNAVLIRSLSTNDLPAFIVLRNASLQQYPDAFTSDYQSEHLKPPQAFELRLGQVENGHGILGAFDPQGVLLGTIGMERESRLQKRHIVQITAMMVAQAAQGQGIAAQLIARCAMVTAENPEIDQLILTVTASNAHVVRLYERAGFVPYGLLPRAIQVNEQFFDKLHMRLDIAAMRRMKSCDLRTLPIR